jgi:hypothetical protein
MSYSLAPLTQVRRTWTFFPAQSAGVPATVSVKVSQLTPSTHSDSIITPPGLTVVPTQVAVCVPVALTVPLAGFCPRVATGRITKSNATPLMRRSVPMVTRAVIEEEEFFFIVVFC